MPHFFIITNNATSVNGEFIIDEKKKTNKFCSSCKTLIRGYGYITIGQIKQGRIELYSKEDIKTTTKYCEECQKNYLKSFKLHTFCDKKNDISKALMVARL